MCRGSLRPHRRRGDDRVGPRQAAPCDDDVVAELARAAARLVSSHPAVRRVELAGSRSRGTHDELSDWDIAVTTSDFAAVARDLPELIAPLRPLGQQWEPLGHFPVYQVLLPGPTKVEYLFLDHSQEAMPALEPGPATLNAINTHFWDWTWWLATKASIGRHDLVDEHLPQLFGRLLRPLGVTAAPADIAAAIDAFVSRRDELELDYGVTVPRALEEEVRAGVRRLGLAA
jgi:Nucleotidyltransferase domain